MRYETDGSTCRLEHGTSGIEPKTYCSIVCLPNNWIITDITFPIFVYAPLIFVEKHPSETEKWSLISNKT